METWKRFYIVSTRNRLQYITELTSFCLEYIYIHHPRIFLHSIHHAWCLWVKMKLVSDDWLKGEWVAFLSNGNTQVNKISGDIFNSTDTYQPTHIDNIMICRQTLIQENDSFTALIYLPQTYTPTHPPRQYND